MDGMITEKAVTASGSSDVPVPSLPQSWPGWPPIQDCVHCGLCLASCPTYLTTGIEMSSPRGRIAMVRALGDGRGGFSPELVKHLDQCLGCLACEVACPSGVIYGHALEETREAIEAEYERAPADRLMRWLLEHLFPYPRRLRWALHALYAYQRFGVSRAVRASGILRALSARVAQMEALLPAVPSPRERRPLPEVTLAARPRRGRAGFLTGCAQRFLLPGLNRATVRVLAAAGYDVVTPPTQGCCGALHAHGGHLGEARSMARAVIETFEGAQVDLVVANAAGCGAAMKQYGHLLRDDATWQARAARFSAQVRDVTQVLADVPWNGDLRPVPASVTYHEACHLAHAQRIRSEPRSVLKQIPGLRLVELTESDLCCGSAGTYNLLQPEMANRLLARKVDRIREANTDFVAAGNIGCLLQIALGLQQAGARTRAVHPVELLDWALHGMPGRTEHR
jgi:glycolate oxidase iron-sulfur subunit